MTEDWNWVGILSFDKLRCIHLLCAWVEKKKEKEISAKSSLSFYSINKL